MGCGHIMLECRHACIEVGVVVGEGLETLIESVVVVGDLVFNSA